MALTMIPYLIGYSLSNGKHFLWLGYNFDDSCVYLSWMRQAAEGSTKTLNLFTTDPQSGLAPNPFFWVLGLTARIIRLPLIFIYHISRLLCGFALLVVVNELIIVTLAKTRERTLAFLFVCFSSGVGWLPVFWNVAAPQPIDTWQPEAITFLSLLLSPLFCFSLSLQAGIILLLLKAERTSNFRYAVFAGVLGLALGMTHTYDVVSISAFWFTYLLKQTFFTSTLPAKKTAHKTLIWLHAAIAGAITMPAVGFIYYQLQHETVFRERANVQTPSAELRWVLLGYGVTLALALLGAISCKLTEKLNPSNEELKVEPEGRQETPWLLILWAITNIAVSYLPTAFQRKMLQGAHLPIAILAGAGAVWLFDKLEMPFFKKRFPLYALCITLLLSPTNLLFVLREISGYAANLAHTQIHRTAIQPGEIEALKWIETNTPPNSALQPLPWIDLLTNEQGRTQVYPKDIALACLTPGLTHRAVYCGHWGETPDYGTKLAEVSRLLQDRTSDEERIALLKKMKVQYLIFSQKSSVASDERLNRLMPVFRDQAPTPRYLKLKYSNQDADVYEFAPDSN